jgi:hypothetical protein
MHLVNRNLYKHIVSLTLLVVSVYLADIDLSDGAGPTYITVMERPMRKVSEMIQDEEDDDEVSRRQVVEQEKKKNPPKSTELKEATGSISHKVIQDSEVNICIRASMAGSKSPMRFGLRVEELSEEEFNEEAAAAAELSGGEADVDKHLSRMEYQLGHLENLMHAMIKNADMAKDVDAVNHRHTDAMYKATTFWPFVHVGILLVTGFTQVNHIVGFFKSRRII